jgi:hypothetical protein
MARILHTKSDKSTKTRRFVFDQVCGRVEGWWAGKARQRASR